MELSEKNNVFGLGKILGFFYQKLKLALTVLKNEHMQTGGPKMLTKVKVSSEIA